MKEEMKKSTIVAGDFDTFFHQLTEMQIHRRFKKHNQPRDLIDIHKTLLPKAAT